MEWEVPVVYYHDERLLRAANLSETYGVTEHVARCVVVAPCTWSLVGIHDFICLRRRFWNGRV